MKNIHTKVDEKTKRVNLHIKSFLMMVNCCFRAVKEVKIKSQNIDDFRHNVAYAIRGWLQLFDNRSNL